VELVVYDYDLGMAPDFLGRLTINLDTLPLNETKEMDLSLNEVNRGTIQFSCELISFKKKSSQSEGQSQGQEQDEELFYHFPKNALQCDELEMEEGYRLPDDQEEKPHPHQHQPRGHPHDGGPSTGLGSSTTAGDGSDPRSSSVRLSRRGVGGGGIGGLLTVTTLHGKHFKAHSLLSALKPYLIITIGSSPSAVKYTTAVQRVSADCQVTFEETFHITVQDPLKATFNLKVSLTMPPLSVSPSCPS
jgi:hypothetical protein